jgi:predicted  nucleic acid-binding Zn-ribbon protein
MIVCSLLLTGGVVVFVNRAEDYRKARDAKELALQRVQGERDAAQASAVAAQANEKEQSRQANSKIAELNGEVLKRDQQIAALGVDKAQLTNQIATLTTQGTVMAQANAAVNQNLKDVQGRYDGLVKENDQLRVRNTELSGTNTDFQKKLDAAEREGRWLNEQVVQLKSEIDRCKKVLADKGITADSPLAKAPADIKGVVKAVKVLTTPTGDMPFATISLGSADRVAKGMTFVIVNQNTNDFLAKITIETVETNEAFGRLEGPKDGPGVKDVAVGNIVLSQW